MDGAQGDTPSQKGSAEAPSRSEPWRGHGEKQAEEVRRRVMPPCRWGEESGQSALTPTCLDIWALWPCQTY